MKQIIKEIIKDRKRCYFVSPHLDDAAFSAGGLISYLAKKTKVTVITAFTSAGRDQHSLSALAYAKMCGYKKSEIGKFFSARRKEDKEVFASLGVEPVHLGFFDALWRKKRQLNIFYKFLSFFLDDFRYIYPTHRLHISKGKIYPEDKSNLRKLENKLKEIVGSEITPARWPRSRPPRRWDERKQGKFFVFCPLGLGRHVDHIMTREACVNVFPNVIFWEDSPYNLYHYHKLDKGFIKKNDLKRKVFDKNQSNRKALYPAYKTQFGKLFGGKDFSLPPETYYLKYPRRNEKKNKCY